MKIILTDLETNKQKTIYSGYEFFEEMSEKEKQEIKEGTIDSIIRESYLLAYPTDFFSTKFKR